MKKRALLFVLLMTSFVALKSQDFVTKEVATRNALIEEFTGRKCINCPVGHIESKYIESLYPGKVWSVNIHGGYYSTLDYPNLNTAISDTLGVHFNPQLFPSALINRQNTSPYPSTRWRASVEEIIAQTAECNIAGQVSINPLTRMATITVELYYTSNSSSDVNYLNVFMLQDSILGAQTGAESNPDQMVGDEYCHMHVLRDNVTPFWGDEITETSEGAFITKKYEYQIPEIIGTPNGMETVLENLNFIAFVTDDNHGSILNVNELNTFIGTDESVLPYVTEIRPKYATTCSYTKTYEILIQNAGKDDINMIKFEIDVDGKDSKEYVWTGNIPSDQTQIIEYDVKVPSGKHSLNVKLKEANDVKFNIEKSLDVVSEEWTNLIIEGEKEVFTIEVAQDKNGKQTTWELRASDHTLLASGGPYSTLVGGNSVTKVHTTKVALSSGDCVRFTINDQIGDGICCAYGEGYYKIIDSKGNVVVDGDGDFGSQAVHNLSVLNEEDIVYEPKYVSTEAANRNVIIEEFTGRNCPNCPKGHIISNGIVKENPGRAWSMAIHSGYFTPNTYPNFQTDISATFMDPYDDVDGGLSLPAALINRTTDAAVSRGIWAESANEVLKQAAECNVAGHVVINPITRTANILAEVYYTADGSDNSDYLTIVMLQDSIIGQQAYAETNPAQHMGGDQYCHMHVLRDVITADWGDEIAPATQGSFIRKTYEYKIPEIIGDTNGVAVDMDNISFLAFVTDKYQGITTKPILNVNKLTVEQTSNEKNSPYISEIVMEDGIFCTNDRTFKAHITNVGTNNLTTVDFEVTIDGKNKTRHHWNGSLEPNESTRFDIELELPTGTHEVAFKVYEANGKDLDYVKTVNAVCDEWTELNSEGVEQLELTIEIMQDKYGNHTTWEFMSSDGSVLASGGPYKYLPNASTELHKANVTVSAGDCYKFAIYDSFGNGICCDDGDGYYRIVNAANDNVIVSGNGDFGSGTHNLISVLLTGSVDEEAKSAYAIFPNPVKDILTVKGENMAQVTIFNSLGQIVRKIECNDNIVNINLDSMQPGMYFVNILDVNGKSATSKVSVMR